VICSSSVSNNVHSCLKPIALPVWLAASSCWRGTVLLRSFSYVLLMKKSLPLNDHSTRRTTGFMRQLEPRSDTLISAVCYAFSRLVMVSVAMSKMGLTGLIFVDSWVKAVLLRCLAVSADASSNQTCYSWHVCLSTRQRSGTLRPRHHPAAAAGDTGLHQSWPLAAKQPRSEPRRLQDLGSRAAACI